LSWYLRVSETFEDLALSLADVRLREA